MISIVIPVYNVEKYLRTCIDSVIAQSYTDWELLLVDDGTPDGGGIFVINMLKKTKEYVCFIKRMVASVLQGMSDLIMRVENGLHSLMQMISFHQRFLNIYNAR